MKTDMQLKTDVVAELAWDPAVRSTAIGVAVASTVLATRTSTLVHNGHTATEALTGGLHGAFLALGLIGLAAVPVAFGLVRQRDIASAAGPEQVSESPRSGLTTVA